MGFTNVAEGYILKAGWIVAIIIVAVAVLGAAYYLSMHAESNEEGTKIDLINVNGTVSTVYVDIADTQQAREKGLMYATSLDDDQGMLFIFDVESRESFWMKNTPLPLDMIFVNGGYNIVDINYNATPESEMVFTSRAPCKYVVEVNGGYCKAHGISVGDRIKIY